MATATARPRRGPKPDPQSPNPSNKTPPRHSPTSSSSTLTSLITEVGPPDNLLPTKSDFLKLLVVVLIAAAVAATCHFLASVVNRPVKPFCDSDVVDRDFSLSDLCEPCPSSGRCYNGQLDCTQGYRKYGKLCIEDGDIYETAKKLSEWTKDQLCKDYANYMCDGTGAIWVSEYDLKNMLEKYGQNQGSSVDDAKYTYIKERAMEDINALLDTRTSAEGIKDFKCPNSIGESYKSIACVGRQWIAQHSIFVMAVCAMLAGCALSMMKIRRRWYLRKRADHLYHQVCDILEDNALISQSRGDREAWLVASRLRDHLLLPRERRNPLLWKMVEELVESDSRLDRYPKLVKGESKVVWEWQDYKKLVLSIAVAKKVNRMLSLQRCVIQLYDLLFVDKRTRRNTSFRHQ